MGIASKKIKLTNDYWARDYMPIQLGENEFLKYRYYPDYLVKSKNKKDIECLSLEKVDSQSRQLCGSITQRKENFIATV